MCCLGRLSAKKKLAPIQKKILEEKSRELYDAHIELEKQLEKVKETQTQLVQSEKMASLGQLAAGVAHEINNPIGFINSNIQLLEEYLAPLVETVNVSRELAQAAKDSNKKQIAKCVEQLSNIEESSEHQRVHF